MARGKYANIIDSLPKWNGNDPSYQDKINVVKSAMLEEDPANRQAATLAQKYADLRMEKEVHEELLSEVNLRLEAVSQLLIDSYEVEGTTSLSLLTGPTIRVQFEPHAQVIDHTALRKWAIATGLENDLQLPWQTTNKLTKEALLNGEPEPDGVVAHAKTKIVMTNG